MKVIDRGIDESRDHWDDGELEIVSALCILSEGQEKDELTQEKLKHSFLQR